MQFLPIIIDKSILQSLTLREAKWLFHHFRAVVPPVFFSEIIGDLRKDRHFSTGTGVGDVRMLSGKMDSASIYLSSDVQKIIELELRGQPIPMNGQVMVEGARTVTNARGERGVFLDQTPLQAVLKRWQEGDFDKMDEAFATFWRDRLATIDLEAIIKRTKGLRDKSPKSLGSVADLVDAFLFPDNQNHSNLLKWLSILNVPQTMQDRVIAGWKRSGRPSTRSVFRYSSYVARVDLLFYMAVAHRAITTRASNEIDMEYIKYLPFTFAFASGDKIHADVFPFFARSDQVFLSRDDLKPALAEMATYYDNLSPEEKAKGSANYARFPPLHLDNAVTRAFDKAIPRWREQAVEPDPPRDPEADAALMADLRETMDSIDEQLGRKR